MKRKQVSEVRIKEEQTLKILIWVKKKAKKNKKIRVCARGGEKLSSCQQQMHKKEVFKLVGDKLEKKNVE